MEQKNWQLNEKLEEIGKKRKKFDQQRELKKKETQMKADEKK